MSLLTPEEKAFLDVFLHEATTSPFFSGQASKAFFGMGAEYRDISFLGWAYQHEVGMNLTEFGWGHAAEIAPPLPWPDRETVLRRDQEIKRFWEKAQKSDRVPAAT